METATAVAGRHDSFADAIVSIPAVLFDRVSFAFDDHVVLRDVSFVVPKGSMRLLLGPSGAGKSIVLRLILGLLRPDSGSVVVNGERIDTMNDHDLLRARGDIGMLFQEGALFDSLTVEENVGYRLYEESRMPTARARRLVDDVLEFVGLSEYRDRLPSELSGGQRKRVGIARAMAAEPGLLLLDDPTTGLDPILATAVDDGIVKLRDVKHVSAIVATHQIRDAFYVATHTAVPSARGVEVVDAGAATAGTEFMVLHDAQIAFEGSAAELLSSQDTFLQEFLSGTLPPW